MPNEAKSNPTKKPNVKDDTKKRRLDDIIREREKKHNHSTEGRLREKIAERDMQSNEVQEE